MIKPAEGGKFVFQNQQVTEGLKEYQDDNGTSHIKRAVAILKCYGGFEEYTKALKDKGYDIPILRNDSPEGLGVSINNDNRHSHPGDIPLQIIPQASPLGRLKTAISSEAISEEIQFTDDCTLSPEQINEIKENQKRVIRFAVKNSFKTPLHDDAHSSLKPVKTRTASQVPDIVDDREIRQKCFADKENRGKTLRKVKDGLMSSYITPLTLYLHQSGKDAGTRVALKDGTTIYYTGFGYPNFDDKYCQECEKTSSSYDEKKSELKAIFKQQIFAVLLAREQQIYYGEISNDTKVPLVLNRPFDFMKAETMEGAIALKELVNESLCELFKEKDVADAMTGKIDQILIWDPSMYIYQRDEGGNKIGDPLGNEKFFGDINKFKQALCENGAVDIEAVGMAGYDMISVAKSYQEHSGIKLAIPGMVNPVYQDGEGAMIGLRATEESINVASLGMMQIYLNSQHNPRLANSDILDASTLDRFKSPQISSKPQENSELQLQLQLSSKPVLKLKELIRDELREATSSFDTLFQMENLVGISTGIAVAGTTMLCASALGFGIVSLPVIATAVGVGVVAGGLTYVATKHYAERAQNERILTQ